MKLKMKNILFLFLFACMSAVLVTSCSKENVIGPAQQVEEPFEPEVTHTGNTLMTRSAGNTDTTGLVLDCVVIGFPFDLVDVDGQTYTAFDELSFIDLLSITPAIEFVDFVYPLDIIHENGNISQVNDAMELGELFAECVPAGGWSEDFFPAYLIDLDNSCLVLQYPLDLEDESGTIVTADSEEAFVALLAEKPYQFVFPISLEDQDGLVFQANNVDELFSLLLSCNEFEYDTTVYDWENGFEYYACYIIEFPLDVTLNDGTVVTVNNHMELCDLMITGSIAGYAYPLTLVREDGTTVVVNNDEELNTAVEDCPGWNGNNNPNGNAIILLFGAYLEEPMPVCYTINYPITIENFEDPTDTVILNSDEEFANVPFLESYDVQFPVDVTSLSTGLIITINDLLELEQVITECL